MNSMRAGLTVAAIVLGTMTAWAGIKTAGNSGSATLGTAGYAITAPSGGNWRPLPSAEGQAFLNASEDFVMRGRVDAASLSTFNSAGFSAAPTPAFADRASFLAFVKLA